MGDRGYTIKQGDTIKSIADRYGITEQELIAANQGVLPAVGVELKIPGEGMWGNIATPGQGGTGGFIQNIGARMSGDKGIDLMDEFKNLPMGHKLAVGALGLNTLAQTGAFDEEEMGQTPEYITGGIQGMADYNAQPLRVANTSPYKFDPSIGSPVGVTQFKPMKSRNKSLRQVLSELKDQDLRTPFPTFT
jgi:LysM repeat protein